MSVLLISENGKPVVGNPLVEGASVEAEVVDQIRGKKIIVFKKKRRKNYRRKIGHKQNLTSIKITAINTKKTKTAEKKVEDKTKTATTKKKTSVKATSKGKKE